MKKCVFTLSLILSSLLMANTQTDELFSMSLEELMNVDIVGSTKTNMDILHVPSSVTVFTHKEMQNLGVTTLEALKNYVPGFSSNRSSSASTINNTPLRGNLSGDSSRDILILIDGQRINTDYNGGAGLSRPIISLENIKTVEFIRGPGSALYGSNAFSAVINMITLSGINSINLRAGTNGLQASALVSVVDEDFIFDAFVKGIKDNGDSSENIDDPYTAFDMYLKMKYENFSLYISHSEQDAEEFYVLKTPSDKNDFKTDISYIRAVYDLEVTNTFVSSLALSFSQSNTEIFLDQGYIFGPTNSPLYAKAKIKEQTPSIEWFNDYKINTKHSFQFGAEYRQPKMKTLDGSFNYALYPQSSPPVVPPYTPGYTTYPIGLENSRDIYGIYGQYQGEVASDIHLTLGVRYDHYSDFGSSVNPRTALVYTYTPNTSFKLLYSSAFRAPSRNELDLKNNGLVIGNPDLDAETINSYEFVTVYKQDNHQFSFSVFRNELKDIIIDMPNSSGVTQRENSDDLTFQGLDLEYEAIYFTNLQTRITYSHIFDMPDESFRSPENLASLILNYNHKSYNFNMSGYFHDKVENDYNGNLETLGSYTIINSKIAYNYDENLVLYVQGTNLFDKKYYTTSYGSINTVNIPNRGIEGFIGLEYRF